MNAHFENRQDCFCAFCKTPRRIYKKRTMSLFNIVASAITSIVLMLLMWQEYDPRALIIFVLCVAASVVFIELRWRLSVICRTCGFDPIIYKKQPDLAAQRVKEMLELRRQDPKYLLAKPLNLPAISEKKAMALKNKESGQLVSRSI
jgi:hypothetical protein